jgi:hypothetical protein
MTNSGKKPEPIAEKKSDIQQQKRPPQNVTPTDWKAGIIVLFGGLVTVVSLLAPIVDKPYLFWVAGFGIAIAVGATYFAAERHFPRFTGILGLSCLVLLLGDLFLVGHLTEKFWSTQPNVSTTDLHQPTVQQTPELRYPAFHDTSETVMFSLGGISAPKSIAQLKNRPFKPFYFDGFFPVTMYLSGNNELLVDFTTWSASGQPAIEVKGNDFSVRPLGWDRNSNANAFEVVNDKQQPVFQLIRASPKHIVVNGIFLLPDGKLIIANYPRAITGVRPEQFALFANVAPAAIFKYPAWKYPGKYADNSN